MKPAVAALMTALSTTLALKGLVFESGGVEGSLGRGVVMRNARMAGPGFEVRVPVLRAKARLMPLLRGRVELEELELERPELIVSPKTARPGPPSSGTPSAAPRPWTFDVGRWTIRGGRARLAVAPEALRTLTEVEATGTAAAGIFVVERASARAGAWLLRASGRTAFFPAAVSGRFTARRGEVEAAGRLSWRRGGGRGRLELSAPGLSAEVWGEREALGALTGGWTARAGPAALRRWARGLPVSAVVSGGSFSGPPASLRVKGTARAERGAALALRFEGAAADHALELSYSSGPASARALGRGSWRDGAWRSDLDLDFGSGRGRALVRADRDGARVRVEVSGLEPGLWREAGLWPARLDGRVSVAAEVSRGRVDVERLEWRPARGRVEGSGLVLLKSGAASWTGTARAEGLGVDGFLRLPRGLEAPGLTLDGEVEARSSTAGAVLSGRAVLSAQRLAYPRAGLSVAAPAAQFEARGRRLRAVSAPARLEGGGELELTGELGVEGPDLRLVARDADFELQDGFKGRAGADVRLTGSWRAPFAKGEVVVARAEYRPPRKKDAGKAAAPPAPAPPAAPPRSGLAFDLRLRADRGVWFRDKLTTLEVKGDLRARGRAGEPPELTGAVETVRGQLSYLGRAFQLKRARAALSGEHPPDPALEAESEWIDPRTRTRVIMRASGTARAPKLALSSEPPMDERDILSFLAFGRPLYQVGQTRGRSSEEAAALVADYLAQGVGQYLPVDLFNVKLTDNQKADLSVGRYVSRNLFLSYGQTFEQHGERRFAADYRLNDQWSLQTQGFGGGRYVLDLLFNYGLR